MTDSRWEQAFIISHLPSFIEARLDNYPQDGEFQRIGNWVGIRGDLQTISALTVDTAGIEAFSNLTSAQASALIPRLSLSKVPTPYARQIWEEDPRSEGNPMPLQVPIVFSDSAGFTAATGDVTTTGFTAAITDIRGAGIKEISIEQKFSMPGIVNDLIDVTFEFDSMKTFVGNQRTGVGFLDLIPTDNAMVNTNGRADVLWYLQMSVGWNIPNGYESLFAGPMGMATLESIRTTIQTYHLGYGGEHSINIQPDGRVELKIKYLPSARARDLTGMNSSIRGDILGRASRSTSANFRKKLDDLRKELEELKEAQKESRKADRKARSARQQEIDKIRQEAVKAEKAAYENYYNNNPPEMNIMSQNGFQAPPHLDPNNKADKEKIDKEYAKWKASNLEQLATTGVFGFNNGELFENADPGFDLVEKIQKGLKDASTKWNKQLNTMKKERAMQQKRVQAIQSEIQQLRDHPVNAPNMEDKYASILRTLFMKGQVHYISLSHVEQQKASRWSRTISKAHAAFRGGGGYGEGWINSIRERIGVGGADKGSINFDVPQMTGELSNDQIAAFNQAVQKALKNPPDTSKILTAAINQDPINPTSQSSKINDKRVYWIYLGDLMSVVMDNYYHNSGEEEANERKNPSEAAIYDSLMLGDFYYNTYPKNGKPRKKAPEETVISRAYHLGDFPISLGTFTKFFSERFVSAGYSAVSLQVFLEELCLYLFGSESLTSTHQHCWGPFLNPYLPAQRFDMNYTNFSSPVKLERGPAQVISVGGFYDTSTPEFRGKPWKPDPELLNSINNKDGLLYNYFCLGPESVEASPSRPVFTVFLGSQNSFVKDVRYSHQKSNEHLQSEQIIRGAASGNGLMKLGNMMMYEVELTLLGSPFFKPGQCFELNNNVFGMASTGEMPWDVLQAYGENLDDLLPRIVIVQEVVHKFDAGTFETKVKALPSGTSYKDFIENRTGDLISNLPRPGTGKRKGASGEGTGRLGTTKRPFFTGAPGAKL